MSPIEEEELRRKRRHQAYQKYQEQLDAIDTKDEKGVEGKLGGKKVTRKDDVETLPASLFKKTIKP